MTRIICLWLVALTAARPAPAVPPLSEVEALATFATVPGALQHDRNGAITRATLSSARVSDRQFAALAAFPYLTRLTIGKIPLSGERLKHIRAIPHLEELTVSGSTMPKGWLVELAAIPKLRILRLMNGQITNDDLLQLKGLNQLEHLYLPSSITDDGLAHLRLLPKLASLQVTGIQGRGLRHLAGTPVHKVVLTNCPIREDQLTALGHSRNCNS